MNEDFQYPTHLTTKLDINYAQSNLESNTLDLFYDEDQIGETNPCVVWIHGGGWRFGDKRDTVHRLYEFATAGYVCVTINYRLSSESIFPAQIIDCRKAIRFLRENAKQFKINADSIAVWGGSAGGHLAALLGTASAHSYDGENIGSEISHKVQAVCSWFGAFDLLSMEEFPEGVESRIPHMTADSLDGMLVGGDVREKKELCALVNPSTYICGDEPPFLLMHGTHDDFVPVDQSIDLHNNLLNKQSDSSLLVIPNAGHNADGFEDHHIKMVLDFFNWKLKNY